jgi:nucleotide-binding universal stress UspA family protein
MNPWLVLLGVIVLAALFVIVPVAYATASFWRRPWIVRCPRKGVDARVTVDAGRAAAAEVIGRPRLDVAGCSLWRTFAGLESCAQECLSLPAAARRPAPPGWRDHAGIRTILVPLDGSPGSEAVLPTAADLARAHGAHLRLARVVPPPGIVETSEERVVVFVDQEAARIENEEREYLGRLASRLEGVDVEMVVRFGDPIPELAEEAESAQADLIVMATHHRRGILRAVKGSVAEGVARAAAVPVVLVPYGEPAAA